MTIGPSSDSTMSINAVFVACVELHIAFLQVDICHICFFAAVLSVTQLHLQGVVL